MKIAQVENRFFLLRFGVHCPTFKKVDKGVSAVACNSHGAGIDAGNFIKNLIDPATKRALDRVQMAARNKANSKTYSFDGVFRLGLIEEIDEVMANARLARDELEKAWADILLNEDRYNEAVARHKDTLGSMYNDKEIPSFDTLKKKFWVELDVRQIINPDQFAALNVANDEIQRIAKETEERTGKAFKSAIGSLKSDIVKALAGDGKNSPGILGIINKIDNKQKTKVHPTLISNLDSLVKKIENVDGFNDVALCNAVKEIKEKITCNSTVQIKHNEKTRAEIKLTALDAIDKLQRVDLDDDSQDMVDAMSGFNF